MILITHFGNLALGVNPNPNPNHANNLQMCVWHDDFLLLLLM